MFKTFLSRNKFPAKIILLTFIFCFIFISNGFTAEISTQNDIFNWPLKGEVITRFGSYVHPVSGETKSHSGIDIKGASDSEIFAAASGTVYFLGEIPVRESKSLIKAVTILHPNGYKTTYLQLKDFAVNKDDNVSQGQVIGKLAVSGDVSSPETHLHFGIKDENDNYVDPNKFLPLPPVASDTSNPVPVEISDNSLSGSVETSVVVSENVSTQTQSTDSEGNNLEQAQASEVNNNAGEISSTQVVSQPNEDKASQETSVVVNSLEAQTVIPSPQEENKVIPVLQVNADIPQTNSEAPVNFAEQNSTDSTNENIELKNKMNNETVDVVLSQKEVVPIIPSTRWGRDTPNVIVPKTTFTEQPRRLFYRVVGQASQTPKPQFANPLSPPFTKGGMGGLLLLLTTLGILVFSTELNKLKGYRLEAIGYGSVTYAA